MKSDLTQGDVGTHLYRMSVPMIWGILAIMSMNIVDTFYVGQLGTDPLAAIGFTMPITSILLSLAFGIGIGTSSVIARAIGAQAPQRVKSYATQALFIALSVAGSFALLGFHYMDTIFTWLGAPARLMPLIHDFMDIWFMGSFLVVVPMVGNSAIRAAGKTRIPSLIMISVAVINIVLDPLLIFGLAGFPELGLAGAALATVISYSVALVMGIYYLIRRFDFLSWRACYQDVVAAWRAILHLAIPATGTNLIAPLSVALTTWMVARFGPEAVAGFSVAARVESLCIVVIMGVSSIMGPFVGQNWGADARHRVAQGLSITFRFVTLWGLGVSIVLWLLAPTVSSWFSEDPRVISSAAWYLYLVPVSYLFLGIIMLSSATANGMGNPTPSLVMSFMRLLGLYLPLAFGLSYFLDLAGIYLAASLANILVGLGAILWSRPLRHAPAPN